MADMDLEGRSAIQKVIDELQQCLTDPNYIQESLDDMSEVLTSKGSDYSGSHTWTAFEWAGNIANVTPDEAMLVLVGIKFARLSTLLRSRWDHMWAGKTESFIPKNEPILDSWLDMTNYLVLLMAYHKYKEAKNANRLNSTNGTPE